MTKSGRRPYLAAVEVCSKRQVLRDTVIICPDIEPGLAKKLVLKKAAEMRRVGNRFVAVTPLEGFFYDKKTYYSSMPKCSEEAVTRAHERFHEDVDSLGINTLGDAAIMEESAAYAWQSSSSFRSREEQLEAARQAGRYSYFAIRSARFLYALGLPEPNGVLRNSVGDITKKARYIRGDAFAIAFSYVKDFALYLECIGILRSWGMWDGKRILMDAMGLAEKEGLNEARQFLICHLCLREKEGLDRAYGFDSGSFAFPRINSPRVLDETLLLQQKSGQFVFEEF